MTQTLVPESSDSSTLVALDGATIDNEDEDACLDGIASDASTQASAYIEDPAIERSCWHGLLLSVNMEAEFAYGQVDKVTDEMTLNLYINTLFDLAQSDNSDSETGRH